MSEQNKIDEIKEALAEATEIRTSPWNIGTPSPNGCINIGSRGVMVAQCLESSTAVLIAKAPEYITYLLQEIERLQQEPKMFEKAFDNADKQYLKQEKLAAQFRKENERLRAEIERKDEALRFYADEDNYKVAITETDWGPILAIDKDSGKRAREAL